METQKLIAKWSKETFGPVHSENVLIARMKEEIEELLTECANALEQQDIEPANNMLISALGILKEVADVYIVACIFADRYNIDLKGLIEDKMLINRKRKWKCNGDGTGQHVKSDKADERIINVSRYTKENFIAHRYTTLGLVPHIFLKYIRDVFPDGSIILYDRSDVSFPETISCERGDWIVLKHNNGRCHVYDNKEFTSIFGKKDQSTNTKKHTNDEQSPDGEF